MGGVRVAKGGSEDVGRPEVGAKDEARNLSLSSVVTGLSSVKEEGDRVVTSSSLAQGAAGGMSSREPVWQAAPGTGSLGPAHPDRGPVVGIEPGACEALCQWRGTIAAPWNRWWRLTWILSTCLGRVHALL